MSASADAAITASAATPSHLQILAGSLHPGRRVELPATTPMCNLHLALAQRMGTKLSHFGDSTGVVDTV